MSHYQRMKARKKRKSLQRSLKPRLKVKVGKTELGVVWKELGRDTFDKWYEYMKQSRNLNELLLGCKMLNRLFEESYEYIEGCMQDVKPKKGESGRKAKLRCLKKLAEAGEDSSRSQENEENEEDEEKAPMEIVLIKG